jgi:hypothetical protein
MNTKTAMSARTANQHSEFLILPGGEILAHNLTPAMAKILSELDPDDEPMRRRANLQKTLKHEFSN